MNLKHFWNKSGNVTELIKLEFYTKNKMDPSIAILYLTFL